MIAFRVDTQCGMGHFMRMKWLAVELEKRNVPTIFFIDQSDAIARFTNDLNAELVIVPQTDSCQGDARFCLTYLKSHKHEIKWFIVDGYTFDESWEAEIKAYGIKLLAVDDLARQHKSDAVLDIKWVGSVTSDRYEGLVPAETDKLLGPAFAILSPEYHLAANTSFSRTNRITFSLGGGGSWRTLSTVIEQLCTLEPAIDEIVAIIGPKATEVEALESFCKQYSHLTLVHAPSSLSEYYKETGLFVGALGTSLYELASTKTPALTFSLAANQNNNIEDLEQLGHFYHIEDLLTFPADKVARLIHSLFEHRKLIEQQRSRPAVPVDGQGTWHIADYLISGYLLDRLPKLEEPELGEEVSKLTDSLSVREIQLSDVNRYLSARNRSENMWRMTITDSIKPIDHYTWWFNNQRHSFVLEDNGSPLIYVWHQVYRHKDAEYLYGGWFAASDKVNFIHAQMILKWQLAYCEALHPNATWVAVINKENKFVNLLNQKEGFIELDKASDAFLVTQCLFPQASEEEFNYVAKFPASRG
ncbi:UDP-2,4-diacetamido-2,4,6-trideoxy-beta-L-altropyranose hydrolase [Pseudoalteromonas luteoviolacea]|uniref:UDP-2,4-diacetamido-2,4, 6-trideoxy-beta-L-altropyranose hydrolase n=1 Tax=Pseudoalteromonas luteoviolacea TaxID=43657 RepID=A0A1C0TX97_9GAMM|nr:UDP-2,4-diacetamido-2,4,6-trideoxy-beta-L-altropyranose hydrolase [Pseudoalteromonas luteoviolacea]OCQ23941.1 UDP-2,4-diacetamido-2,4,6-trideoxy-beta-L-altropyranose hydrolase [Pseudoalteromonas luteoviolacea]